MWNLVHNIFRKEIQHLANHHAMYGCALVPGVVADKLFWFMAKRARSANGSLCSH